MSGCSLDSVQKDYYDVSGDEGGAGSDDAAVRHGTGAGDCRGWL